MDTKVRIIRPDGNTENDQITVRNNNVLADLQEAVGGYIEIVDLPETNMLMVVDEEGLLKDKEENFVASVLAGQRIVGTVAIVPSGLFN